MQYAPGETFSGGRFEIHEVLGDGGFSTVYRVLDTVEQEERALKVFNSAAGYDAVRQGDGALRKVQHPNVVKVFWADRADAASGGSCRSCGRRDARPVSRPEGST